MTFHLTTLGSCALYDEKGDRVNVPKQALLMLAYLRDCRQSIPRKELAAFLWSGNVQAAGVNLRSTLLRLATATSKSPKPLISGVAANIALNFDALRCDLDTIENTSGVAKLSALSDAVAKNFLPIYGSGFIAVAVWVRDVRARLAGELRTEFFKALNAPSSPQYRGELKRAAMLLLDRDHSDNEVRIALGEKITSYIQVIGETKDPTSSHPAEDTIPLSADGRVPRIALLPPETLEAAERAGSVANAVIEDLTISLCVDRSVSVVAPYTAEQIRSSNDKAGLLRQHNVVYALDTKRTGDSLFAQLIFMPRDEIVWATRVQLDSAAITEHRNEIATAIQHSIIERVGAFHHIVSDFSCKPQAYFAYLEGVQCLSRLGLQNVRRARKHFREALEHERGFAAALAGIARTLTMEWVLTARGDSDLLSQAEKMAADAIRDDSRFAGGFKEIGVARLYRGNIDGSLEALSNAEDLSPHYADVICSHADSLTHGANPKAALAKVAMALDLNPLAPDYYYWTAAGASYFLGEYTEALAYLDRMREPGPASRLAAASWAMLGDAAKAKTYRLRALRDNPNFDLEAWLSMIPNKEKWQTEHYREGLLKAGF
jgi:tetratricopeptide (TPR) repeat protein/TolB-like protein